MTLGSEHEDPPRLEDEGPEPLRAFVRSRQAGPSAAALERMSKRLAAPAPSTPGATTGQSLRRYKLGVLVVAVAAGLAISWRATHTSETAVPPAPAESAQTLALAPSPAEAPAPQAGHESPAAISVDKLPSVPPPATHTPNPPSAPGRKGNDGAHASSSELDVIQRAQDALPVDARGALAITKEHERDYPAGEFVQEREVIAVEALVKLGNRDEASRRAVALANRFPNTPYTARLEKALGHSLRAPTP